MTQLSSRLTLALFFTLVSSLIHCQRSLAQITPDNSLGAENSRIRPDTIKNTPSDVIEGGASRGSNLFHSFREFNIKEGRGAYFANPAAIQNIFTRVTGGKVSNILGTLGVLGNANLFLINPNGIIFGPNARLDIRGAFIGSTANSLVFDNNFEFSATNPDAPPLLTVNMPIGLRFREQAGDINSTANLATPGNLTLQAGNLNLSGSVVAGGDLTLEALNTLTIRDTAISPFTAVSGGNLLLQGNQNIDIFALNHPNSGLFSGGDMVLRSANTVGGDAHYWSGGSFRIEKLDGSLGDLYSPNDPVIRTGGDVFINAYGGASLHIIAGGKVEIPTLVWITGADPVNGLVETVTLSNGTSVNINGKTEATLDIRAGVSPEFIGVPIGLTGGFPLPPSLTDTPNGADIDVGTIIFRDINFNPIIGNVLLTNQYYPNRSLEGSITANSSLSGFEAIQTGSNDNGGRVTIDSRNNISIKGNIDSTSQAKGGDILLNSVGDIFITNSYINVRSGKDGNININANNINIMNSRVLAGIENGLGDKDAQAGDIQLNATQDIVVESSIISNLISSQAYGNAGDIKFETKNLQLLNDTRVGTITLGSGNTGKVIINVTETMTLQDSRVASLVLREARGNSGGIEIKAGSLFLSDEAIIDASTFGQGNAGLVFLDISENLTLGDGSIIYSRVESSAFGEGGRIFIETNTFSLKNGSRISTSIFGQANGEENTGGVEIKTGSLNALDGAAIFSNVVGTGNAGGIEITTGSLFLSDFSQINASTFGQGNGGGIKINASDTINLSESRIISRVENTAKGNAGGIEITTDSLFLSDGSQVNASTFGQGNGEGLKITAGDIIFLSESSIISRVENTAKGNAEGIEITTGSLYLTDAAQINANVLGQGDGGGIKITASEIVFLSESGIFNAVGDTGIGSSGKFEVSAGTLELRDGSVFNSSTLGTGNAGKMIINLSDSMTLQNSNIVSSVQSQGKGNSGGIGIKAETLDIIDGSNLIANVFGKGNAGQITLNVSDSITLQGIFSGVYSVAGGNGNSGGIEIKSGTLNILDGAVLDANVFAIGDSGQININATHSITLQGSNISSTVLSEAIGNSGGIEIKSGTLNILDDSVLEANISGVGDSGQININATSITLQGSNIFSAVLSEAIGNSGGIEIKSGTLNILDDSGLYANVLGLGDSGQININAIDSMTLRGSKISSTVLSEIIGNSGGIEIIAGTLNVLDGASLESSTFSLGNAGKISINVSDTMTLKGEDSQGIRSVISNVIYKEATGKAEGIEISAGTLNILDGARILSNVIGRGDAEKISINVSDTMTLRGKDSQGRISNISSLVQSGGVGDSGRIEINANTLNLFDGAELNSSTDGIGNAGKISINVFDTMTLQGENRRGLGSAVISRVNENGTGNSGGIEIHANTLNLFDGARLDSSSRGIGDANKIIINATDTMTLKGESSIGMGNIIFNNIFGQGDSGGIEIKAGTLLLDKGQISNSIFGVGNADKIIINVDGTMTLQGESIFGNSAIFSRVNKGAEGNVSGIEVKAGTLNILDGASLNAGTEGIGNAGKITINVADTITLKGRNSENNVSGVGSEVVLGAEGNSGGIEIKARNLQMLDGATITTSTQGIGNAGKITFDVTDTMTLGESQEGRTSVSSRVLLGAKGDSEGIEVKAGTLELLGGGRLNTTTEGVGDAGKIVVNVTGNITLKGQSNEGNGSSIASAVTPDGEGNSQGIEINATNLILQDAAFITTSTGSNGNAGDIIITAKETVSASGARFFGELVLGGISAFTTNSGEAGNITINTPIFNISDSAEVSAFTTGTGNAGSITINSPQIVNIGQGSKIVVETSGAGKAGDIIITTDTLNIGKDAELSATATETATNPQGGGSITLNTSNLNISGKLGIFAETQGESPAGNLTLKPNNNNPNLNINFTDNGFISASTTAGGDGGNIAISAPQAINIQGDGKIAVETSGSGNAGTIDITTQTLNLADGLEISASTTGEGNAGNINLNGKQINLSQTEINAFTNSAGNAGSITLSNQGNNANQVNLSNNSRISTEIQKDGQSDTPSNIAIKTDNLIVENSTITASTSGKGNAGSITVPNAQKISLNQSEITASTSGEGDTGIIDLNASDNLQLENSQISSSVQQGAVGNSQQITLNTPNLNLNTSEISAATAGIGNAGSIIVPHANTVTLNNSIISTAIAPSGISTQPSNIGIQTQQLSLQNNSQITATTSGIGDAGKISIAANTLDITGNAKIQTNTNSTGKAGDITFTIQDSLNLNGSTIEASTAANSTGNGGNIIIDPITVNLNNGAKITVNSQGEGDGGNIFLTANNLRLNNFSEISATTASGEGGNITLNIFDTLRQDNNSPLTATAGGTGNGGNITINTNFLIRSGNSDITANAFEGIGGNIKITAQGIFQDLRSEITASSELGFDGVVETNTPDVDPSRGLIDLPQNVVDPNSLISRNACRQGSQSEFTVRGRGGLPTSPEQVRSSDEVVVGLVDATEEESSTQVNTSSRMTRKIVPAQGWQMNEKGEVVLLAYPTGNAVNRPENSPLTCSSN